MKKLLRGIALLLLPIILYYIVFIAFEPNNYFGLRAQPFGDDIISRLREYTRAPSDYIIIGDSRLAKFDMQVAEELSGRPFVNLASGGATLKENLDLLDWSRDNNPNLKEVVLGLSFYTLNKSYNHDRNIMQAVNNPIVYMTNLTYNINMLSNVSILSHNAFAPENEQLATGGIGETRDPATYTYSTIPNPCEGGELVIREDLADYALNKISEKTTNWQVNEKELERLIETIEKCQEKGIKVTIVLPPVDDSIWNLVICPKGIEQPMLEAIARLRQTGATVLDYEIENRPAFGDDMFYDGFHPDAERGLPVWEEILFSSL